MPKTLDDMLDERGYPPEVRAALAEDIKKYGTEPMILDGRSVLPSVENAVAWRNRTLAEAGKMPLESASPQTVDDLKKQVADLQQAVAQMQRQPSQPQATEPAAPAPEKGGR